MSRLPELLAYSVVSASLVAGCGSDREPGDARDSVNATMTESVVDFGTIECGGLASTEIEVNPGDLLLGLILNHVEIQEPADMGRPDLPIEEVVNAVAEINDLDNPNEIIAGQTLTMPEFCRASADLRD